jgi:hypothetical protein
MRKGCISQLLPDHVRKVVFGNKVLAGPDQFRTEEIHQSLTIDEGCSSVVVRNVYEMTWHLVEHKLRRDSHYVCLGRSLVLKQSRGLNEMLVISISSAANLVA